MLLNSFSLGFNRGIYSLSLNYQNDTKDEIAFRVLDMEKNDGNNHHWVKYVVSGTFFGSIGE